MNHPETVVDERSYFDEFMSDPRNRAVFEQECLAADWDAYLERLTQPAGRFTAEHIAAVRRLVERIRSACPSLPYPQTAPTEEGALSLCWDVGAHHLEVDIFPADAEFSYSNRDTGECGCGMVGGKSWGYTLNVLADPNSKLRARAFQAASCATMLGISPSRIVATNEGGIAFYYFGEEQLPGGSHVRYATLECTAEGEMIALKGNRLTGEVEAFEVRDLEAALNDLRRHVGRT